MDKQSKITEAAAACFLSRGFAGTSMDQIVAASDVVKQTLYNYFENKEAIFRAAIKHLLVTTQAEFDPAWYRLAPREFFLRVGRALLGSLLQPESTAFLRLLVKECRRFPDLQEVYAQAVPGPFIDFVAAYIESISSSKNAAALSEHGLRASIWYFRFALSGYVTLANLAPNLKYTLPSRPRYLNQLASLFAYYLEETNRSGWQLERDMVLPLSRKTAGSACDIREFLAKSLSGSGEKKTSILEAAVRLFSERGFADTSMDDIALGAAVSKQTVYKHFQNKNFIYSYLARSVLDELQGQIAGAFEADRPELYCQDLSRALCFATEPLWLAEFLRTVFGEAEIFPLESGALLVFLMEFGRDGLEQKLAAVCGAKTDSLSLSIVLRSIIGAQILLRQIYVVGDQLLLSEESAMAFCGKVLAYLGRDAASV